MKVLGQKTRYEGLIFTPQNLLENLDKVGAWSKLGMFETAVCHYYPKAEQDYEELDTVPFLSKWGHLANDEILIKYHQEKGFKCRPQCVNIS